MRIALTGATGLVGHWAAGHLLAHGHAVTTLGRGPSRHAGAAHLSFDLNGDPPDLTGCEVLVHAALAHVPGRFRGGEGADAPGFLRSNLDGTIRLFATARDAGVGRILLLSSRAVYDGYPAGTVLADGLATRPDTLYAQVKDQAEQALQAMAVPGLAVASLRATGVYAPPVAGMDHKWRGLVADFARRDPTAPHAGTEVHATDLAEAIRLLATVDATALAPFSFNVSDFLLDRRDLLAEFAQLSDRDGPLPDRADGAQVNVMTTERLAALGWRGRGRAGLAETLAALAEELRG